MRAVTLSSVESSTWALFQQPKVQSHPWICRVLQAAIISRWPATSTPVSTRSDAEDAGFTPDSRRMLAFQLISAL